MTDDKKRRTSILKVTDRLKENDKNKRKRVSFAPESILREFNEFSNGACATNLSHAPSKSPKKSNLNNSLINNNNNIDEFNTNNGLGSGKPSQKDLENLTNSPILRKSDKFFNDTINEDYRDDTKKPLNIAETLLNTHDRKITRSQVNSILYENSLLDQSVRRSPRIREKSRRGIENSIRVPDDNLIDFENKFPIDYEHPNTKSDYGNLNPIVSINPSNDNSIVLSNPLNDNPIVNTNPPNDNPIVFDNLININAIVNTNPRNNKTNDKQIIDNPISIELHVKRTKSKSPIVKNTRPNPNTCNSPRNKSKTKSSVFARDINSYTVLPDNTNPLIVTCDTVNPSIVSTHNTNPSIVKTNSTNPSIDKKSKNNTSIDKINNIDPSIVSKHYTNPPIINTNTETKEIVKKQTFKSPIAKPIVSETVTNTIDNNPPILSEDLINNLNNNIYINNRNNKNNFKINIDDIYDNNLIPTIKNDINNIENSDMEISELPLNNLIPLNNNNNNINNNDRIINNNLNNINCNNNNNLLNLNNKNNFNINPYLNKSISLIDMDISEDKTKININDNFNNINLNNNKENINNNLNTKNNINELNKINIGDLDTCYLENSSQNEINTNYSQILMQKTKEHQLKILNISQEIKSVLSMSISECADILNQSNNLSRLEPKVFVIPDRLTLILYNMRIDLKSINDFLRMCFKSPVKNNSKSNNNFHIHNPYSNIKSIRDNIHKFNDISFNFLSKIIEFQNFKNKKIDELKLLLTKRDDLLNNYNQISAKNITSFDFVKLSSQLYKKYKIYIFLLNGNKNIYDNNLLIKNIPVLNKNGNFLLIFDNYDNIDVNNENSPTFRIFHKFRVVYYDISNFNDTSLVCKIKFSKTQGFLQLFIKNIEFLQESSPKNLYDLLLLITKINKIYANFKLLYKQFDALSLKTASIQYYNQKIGFKCCCRGLFSFILWLTPVLDSNLSFSMRYDGLSDMVGDFGANNVVDKIMKRLSEERFEVLNFYGFLREICEPELVSEI